MKPKNILIATALIVIVGSFLGGCQWKGAQNGKSSKTALEQWALRAAAAKKEVHLSLKAHRKEGQVQVEITLENPNLKPVTSTQTWLSFDPAKLQGKNIDISNSTFSLTAPYDNNFDNQAGLLMLGRANPKALRQKTIPVATVTFDLVSDGTTMMDGYDYQDDLSGHVSANAMVDGKPFNLLLPPQSPLLAIEN